MSLTAVSIPHEVRDLSLAAQGLQQIEWGERDMPVLGRIRERFKQEQPFKGLKVSTCAHLTKETANLVRAIQAGGADCLVMGSNPISTQDDVAASLVADFGVPTFAVRGETLETYREHVERLLAFEPDIVMDDGGDLIAALMSQKPSWMGKIIGSTEETTAGITRLKALDKQGILPWPAIGVNESRTKHLFDNRYGTGQSTIDSIMRACNILLSGKTVVVAGYGWCGKGCAMRARGLGANVIVTEVDAMKALEAVMEGFRVLPITEAAPLGDVFITVTSNRHAIDAQHFPLMKSGAILCNAGHQNWEFNYTALKNSAVKTEKPRTFVEIFTLKDGKELIALCEGRLVNLIAAEGHPASVMDMSFANQALAVEYLVKNKGKLPNKLLTLPEELDMEIASLKLEALGIAIDTLTPEQEHYLNSWDAGTV